MYQTTVGVRQKFEERVVEPGPKLAADVARHLQDRFLVGTAVIVVERPAVFLSSLRRQWLRLGRITQRQRASTLDRSKITNLTELMGKMSDARFSSSGPSPEADIQLVSPTELCKVSDCSTVYLCTDADPHQLDSLPDETLVVNYELRAA